MKAHNLLKRQIKKTLGQIDEYPPEIKLFIERINQAYYDFDNDRDLLERSLEITSEELVSRYEELKEDNTKLVRAKGELLEKEKKLRYSLREKEALLAEIHHRVKNNLAIVSGLLFLQMDMELDKQVGVKLLEAHQRIQSMAMIHEKLYQGESFSSVPISKFLEELVGSIIEKFKHEGQNIETEIHAQNLQLEIGTAIPVSLLVNEIVTNSLKYAFPKKGEGKIKIELIKTSNNQLLLTVADNGPGIPENVDLENPSSLGILLIHTFLKQLDGTMATHTNNGTAFMFTIPLQKQNNFWVRPKSKTGR